MRSSLLVAVWMIVLLFLAGPVVLAETPDGETPAEENVCDRESGAAYGLCAAFCEAMDCDGKDPSASEAACLKVKDKFIQVTGRQSLPCEGSPPCTFNADCDDNSLCTTDTCDNGVCDFTHSAGCAVNQACDPETGQCL